MTGATFGKKAWLTLTLVAALTLGACDLTQNYLKADRSGNMDVQDYRDALASRIPAKEEEPKADNSIPELQPYVSTEVSESKPMPLVSVSVNQNVPLRDILYELAEQAQYDLELDPRINGSIIFSARNKPFDQVVDRIAELANLRYQFSEGVLKIEMDTPYHEIYKINYLSYVRNNTSSISNDVAVVSGQGTDTGSKYHSEANSEADFWGELETNLTQLLQPGKSAGKVSATKEASAVPPVTMDENGELDAVPLSVGDIQPSAGEEGDENETEASRFSINRQGGIVSVYAPQRLQKKVAQYLDELKRSVTSQVLIEAKVLEVALTDEFAAGIDWGSVNLFGGEGFIGFDVSPDSLVRGVLAPASSPTSNFSISQRGNDFGAAIDALSRFGTVKALASPRLTVLNNQSAVLNVAKNQVYFEIDVDVTTEDNVTRTDVNSEIRNVPEGVLINVQPSIDLDDQSISMAVRPTVTRITDYVNDPAVAFVASQNNLTDIASQIPVVNVQEFDSVIKIDNGQAIVMGGLIQDRTTSSQNAVPVLGEVPVVGALFRNQQDKIEKTELVVLLKATIVEGDNAVHATDKDLYRTFSQDRRPFKL